MTGTIVKQEDVYELIFPTENIFGLCNTELFNLMHRHGLRLDLILRNCLENLISAIINERIVFNTSFIDVAFKDSAYTDKLEDCRREVQKLYINFTHLLGERIYQLISKRIDYYVSCIDVHILDFVTGEDTIYVKFNVDAIPF